METSKFKLSLEQEFHVKAIKVSSEQLDREELQEALVDFTRELLVKDNIIRHLLKTLKYLETEIP